MNIYPSNITDKVGQGSEFKEGGVSKITGSLMTSWKVLLLFTKDFKIPFHRTRSLTISGIFLSFN